MIVMKSLFVLFSLSLLLLSCTDENLNNNTYELVLVEPGIFNMGSNSGFANEKPIHRVQITRPYYIGVFEVTYNQYDSYTMETGKKQIEREEINRGERPAMGIDWFDAVSYCNWLSEKEGYTPCYDIKGVITECNFDADGYRLPTEAEWEFAARGGNNSKGYIYAGSNNADEVAWFEDNSQADYHLVGLKKPNELGLYDMSGNMWEWCWDYWDDSYYERSPVIDPTGPVSVPKQDFTYAVEKSRRSPRWLNSSEYMRVSSRSADFIDYEGDNGIRLVRTKTN
jgi:formylglycine-generating enzyme required for sulfatase activity